MPKDYHRIGFGSVGVAVSLAVAGTVLTRYAARPARSVAIFAASAPLVASTGVVLGLALATDRRGRAAGFAAAALSGAALAAELPTSRADRGRSSAPTLRVTSANLLMGRADAIGLVRWAAAHTDVLVVQELTGDCVARLSAAGIDEVFPHRMLDPRPRAAGIGVWSSHPITQARHVDGPSMPCLSVKVRLPGCPVDPTVVAIHLASPVDIARWRADLAALPSMLRDVDSWANGGAVIVAGDFNSTRDMRPFRDGIAGYADAAEQAGSRYRATFPNLRRWAVPLFVIDHVLTLRCAATSVHTVGIAGSDHRALVTSIDVGTDPSAD